MLKKTIAILLCLVFLWMMIPSMTTFAHPGASAHSFVLMEARTGEVLAERNANEQMLIASTTKIMTAMVTLQHARMDEMVTVDPNAVGIEGSSMYLRSGEELTVGELLFGLMLSSGNDAATALAYHVAGGVEEFAELMNAQADALGMQNSNFQNPHGLDADAHYSTALDMAILTAFALENEDFIEIVSTRSAQVAGRSLVNSNKLLWRYPDAIGVKTGYTRAAGRSLVGAAERNGTRLIVVTLSAPNDWSDHSALFDWGFAHYQYHAVVAEDETFANIPVVSGVMDRVEIVAKEGLGLLLHPDDVVEVVTYFPQMAFAPLIAGSLAGVLMVSVNGETIQEITLFYRDTIDLDETNRLTSWELFRWRVRDFFG